ncbi:hypothetical protein Cs7R123_26820 [Catellatospora sp. TT07R-123]|uniref:hypothetical protein n=1 Tax=Catellatospora sp. TT07R-123 TaxID=2733863 RepID=UPI001B11303E|nr:hypothetical protein [Catellatospora sp. TT07R-123]GHJ45340.1 hypothetical protein Cs7R123_26820 [Catellatospora sp. TT07R-123]
MRRVLRVSIILFALLLTALTGVQFVRSHSAGPLDRTDAEVVADALPRLAFLREALDSGSADRMQQLFPEGYFFSYALYGLTWVEVGARDTAPRERALAEARWALAHLDSDAGRAGFSASLDPPYGVFYQGWATWLRGGVAALAGPGAPELPRLRADAGALAAAFERKLSGSGSPFLTAYPGQAWPCDSVVGLAAVHRADGLTGADHGPLVRSWLAAADSRRDPGTGLLPHTVDAGSGQPTDLARATSQVIILRFLAELDPARGAADWTVFRQRFASTVPGIPGVREYPVGTDRAGDVDSGPLVLGLSTSASAVALGDAVLYRDAPAAAALTGLAEAAGLPVQWQGRRRYLGGALPVGDAFLAWSLATRPGVVTAEGDGPSWTWRLPWYALVLAVLPPWWIVAAILARPRPKLSERRVAPTTASH